MYLPLGLRKAISQTRVLPLIGLGTLNTALPHAGSAAGSNRRKGSFSPWVEAYSESMLPIYEAVAAVAHRCVISLTTDRHLYGVLSASDEHWFRLTSGHDRIDEDHKLLIQLGTTTIALEHDLAIGSLVQTRSDPMLWELARSHAARAPLLVLGCDPADDRVLEVVADLRPNRYFQPAGWFVTSDSSAVTRARWGSLGFEVVSGPMSTLIQELRETGAAHPRVQQLARRPLRRVLNPYKYLDSYTRVDGELFFGRKRETRRLVELVCANRLVVVTGPSGTGKTSLLQAGLLAWSDRNPPFVGVYARCGEDPEASVAAALRTALDDNSPLGSLGSLELLETFASWRRGIPIVTLDQAEELFTRFNDTLRTRFLTVLRKLLTRPDLHARIILGIRDDFLARLADVRQVVPTILQNTFYVPPLERAAALEAIREPSLAAGVHFDSVVAERILDEIGSHRVAPPQIQIVCDSLFRRRRSGEISMDLYERVGGAPAILNEFMEEQLRKLGSQHHLAREVLKAMVTSEGTKDVLTAADISRRANQNSKDVERILFMLRDVCRLVRAVEGDGSMRFELAHEYLTTSIWAWLSEEEKDRRDIEELLIKELRAWRQFKALRLGADRLRRFGEWAHLLEYDSEAITLLLLSTVTHHQDSSVWVERLKQLGDYTQDAVASTLFMYFSDKDVNQRCEAAEVIAAFDPAPLVRALGSPITVYRRAAIEMLGGLGLQSASTHLVRCLEDPDPTCRVLTCGALGAIGGSEVTSLLVGLTRERDVSIACAALKALGRLGIPDSCIDVVTEAMSSTNKDLRATVEAALAQGRSTKILEYLLMNKKQRREATASLWRSMEALPISCRPWLQKIVPTIPTTVLDGGDAIPISSWIGELVQLERLNRGLKSQFVRQWMPAADVGRIRRHDFTDVEGALQRLRGWDKADAIKELAKQGSNIDELVVRLAAHEQSSVRRASLQIIAAREPLRDTATSRQIAEKAMGDPDPSVRAMACHLATRLRLWAGLDRVISTDRDGSVKAAALQGLVAAPLEWIIPVRVIESALKGDALERYWACILASQRKLVELIPMIRPLVWDTTSVALTGYEGERDWATHDAEVGHSVAAAAHAALALLSPVSDVWRKHSSWQVDFQHSLSESD